MIILISYRGGFRNIEKLVFLKSKPILVHMRNFLLIFLFSIFFWVACNDDDATPEDSLHPPEASFTYEAGDGYQVTFYNTGTGHSEVAAWDFGDGNTAEGDTVTHTFSDAGSYDVMLTLSNEDGSDESVEEVPVEHMTYVAEISTSHGNILLYLYRATPLHRENFLELASSGFYDGILFHRVIDNFMIQGGDPNSKDGNPETDGTGGPGYQIPAEILPELTHVHGALGAARQGDDVNPDRESSGSQFYIVDNPQGTPHLDGAYTVFGITITGNDVVHNIARVPRDNNDRPLDNVEMEVMVHLKSAAELEDQYGFTIPE